MGTRNSRNTEMTLKLQVFLFLQLFSLFSCAVTPIERYLKKYSPKTITEGSDHISRQYPKHRIEVTSSFGMTEQTILFIEAVIEDHFKDRFDTDAMNAIQQTIQGYLGGYWGIQFYEDPYAFFSTSFKRSPSFVVLDVSGSGIAVVKDS